jgi:hypothetical protein
MEVAHGTDRGYQQHMRGDRFACGPCLAAHRQRYRELLRQGRCAPGLGWPLGPHDPIPRRAPKRGVARSPVAENGIKGRDLEHVED